MITPLLLYQETIPLLILNILQVKNVHKMYTMLEIDDAVVNTKSLI